MPLQTSGNSKLHSYNNPDDKQPWFVRDDEPADGRWLCADGPYQDYITKLCGSNPALGQANPENSAIPLSKRAASVTLLTVDGNGTYHRVSKFDSSQGLHKLQQQLRGSASGSKNIWIVENINPHLVAILGEHFKMDPRFFLDFERSSKWRRWAHEPNLAPALPALINSTGFFSLKYYDLRDFGPEINSYSVSCADTGRHISRIKWKDNWVSPSIVDRSCSVYSRTTEQNGWVLVILCDPPLRHVHVWKQTQGSNNYPYEVILREDRALQHGYPDFLPPHTYPSPAIPGGPPRNSLSGDLIYYLLNHTSCPPTQFSATDLEVPLLYVRKIIASHYMQLVKFTTSYLARFEWPLLRRESLDDFTITWTERHWSEIQGASRRCNKYVENLESLFLSLNVPFGEPQIGSDKRDWTDTNLDFQFLLHQAKSVKSRANELNNAFTGLTGIVGNSQARREAERSLNEAKRSVREAKNMKALTLIAMIFIPLAFTCGLFSMSDRYIPGEGKFWVFFAVSVPLVILVFIGAFVGELGYDDDGEWVWVTFWANLRAVVTRKSREQI